MSELCSSFKINQLFSSCSLPDQSFPHHRHCQRHHNLLLEICWNKGRCQTYIYGICPHIFLQENHKRRGWGTPLIQKPIIRKKKTTLNSVFPSVSFFCARIYSANWGGTPVTDSVNLFLTPFQTNVAFHNESCMDCEYIIG